MNYLIKISLIILLIIFLLLFILSIITKKIYEGLSRVYDKKIDSLKKELIPLNRLFRKNNKQYNIEDINIYRGDKSYTLDKNVIYLCLYDEYDRYYPDNFLKYVLIHELAHYFNTEDIGHTPAFYKKFDEFLEVAISKNIYDPSVPHIENYCPGEESFSLLPSIFNF